MRSAWAVILAAAQTLLAVRVAARLLSSARGTRIAITTKVDADRISVIVPVLNERRRLAPCLEGLIAQGTVVAEILVVDGGSTDGTPDLVRAFAGRDRRLCLVDAGPIPAGWNGKAWGLQVGLDHSSAEAGWTLMLDADVRPAPALASSLVAHARRVGVDALSVAASQTLGDWTEGLVHPAMLATLVYRFGIPGRATTLVRQAQANGQCFLAKHAVLAATDAIRQARASRCEDVTMARVLVRHGHAVGFYEAPGLVAVTMYGSGAETWRNWPRSLPLRDQFWGLAGPIGLLEVTIVQALPLAILAFASLLPERRRLAAVRLRQLNVALLALRLGVLAGTARAYPTRPWSYWLSPLLDLPVALRLWQSAFRRRHIWRGRAMVGG